MKKELIKVDKNGTKYWEFSCTCSKCNGTGIYRWQAYHYTGTISDYEGVCFACNGTGTARWQEKEYTAEHRAELDARREKKLQKKQAELAKIEAERKAQEEEQARKQAEREALWAEQKAASNFVGSVGDKLSIEVTFTHEVSLDTQFGTQYIYFFKDDAGNTLAWKTSAMLS